MHRCIGADVNQAGARGSGGDFRAAHDLASHDIGQRRPRRMAPFDFQADVSQDAVEFVRGGQIRHERFEPVAGYVHLAELAQKAHVVFK